MSNEKLNLQEISSTMMQLFVQDVFNKNNITEEKKNKLSDEQKAQLRKVVEDLQAQVDEFVKGSKQKQEKEEPVEETSKNTTLRDMIKKKKEDK
ncbi:spore coat protein W [Metabacillus crassostreae]|uniref:hypothetical protein n=1 Tax=Metabacillus crassostreae TaxID=929098 RepID=UPI001957B2E8|nr:hypothetical protein [Metabacillus crassostreae]MBM7604037.1 spore coat protein W [Metabacillus crassostreae]